MGCAPGSPNSPWTARCFQEVADPRRPRKKRAARAGRAQRNCAANSRCARAFRRRPAAEAGP
eukprot:181517-Alexandrium_andersonii.AAC.1